MTNKEAWLTIAEAFLTPWDNRTVRQHRITTTGVCSAIANLWVDRQLTDQQWDDMYDIVESDVRGDGYFIRRFDKQADEWRGLYCLFMAAGGDA